MNSESVNLIYLDPPFNSNDHDELCRDRLLALLCDRDYLTGEFRRLESDRGKPLAGKSTLNQLELTPAEGPEGRYRKIVADPAGMDALLIKVFLEAYREPLRLSSRG